MKQFQEYITEGYIKFQDLQHIQSAIAEYKKAGEVLNPEYKELKNQTARLFSKAARVYENKFSDVAREVQDEDIWEMTHALSAYTITDIAKLHKMVQKAEKRNFTRPDIVEIIKIAKRLAAEWKPVYDDIKALKDKVVKVTTKRAEAKQVATKALEKKFRDSSSLIKVLESHLDEYKQAARKRAEEFVKSKMEELESHGWDAEVAAPRPKSSMGRESYHIAMDKRRIISALTVSANKYGTRSMGDPDIRKPNPVAIARYIDEAEKGAEASYRQFMAKMISKIGKPVVDAKMTGNIWTDATLTVTADDGEKQVWITRMILNFSKYQRMFNQFPSRRKS
jgi:hypothetical protein